jgi:sulfite exporter TauE/SafE
MDLLSGFVVGILGSFHCMAMCGPIAIAIPAAHTAGMAYVAGRILYNSGRTMTYVLLGALMGSIGGLFALAGMQRAVSIAVGCSMILALLLPPVGRLFSSRWSFLSSLHTVFRARLGTLLRRRSLMSLLLIGVVNGFLPCGFLYIALAGAATLGDIPKGMAFLAGFGLGTFPVMLGISLIGRTFRPDIRRKASALLPVFTFLLAVLFILRGLNLGIPYVSPQLQETASASGSTCH